MIIDLIKKDFSYTRRISFLFVIILAVLVMFSSALAWINYNYQKNTLNDENEGFVHNIAMFYIEQQLKTLENALWQSATLLNNKNVDTLVNAENEVLEKQLTTSIAVLPAISGYIIATRDGKYNSIPNSYVDNRLDLSGRNWYESLSVKSSFVNYSNIYANAVDKSPVVTIAKLLHDDKGERYGMFAMDLNLINMSYPLRQLESPNPGHFSIVDRQGRAVLDADSDAIGTEVVSPAVVQCMTNGLGSFHDKASHKQYYYYSLSNPDWFVVYAVKDRMIDDAVLYFVWIILGGFVFCLTIYLLLWFFMHQSIKSMVIDIISMMRFGRLDMKGGVDKQIMNEINASSQQIKSAKNASLTDGLTGLLNRRSFDNDINYLLAREAPFSLGIIDIDNFKKINDDYGHLVGDTVLKVIADMGMGLLDDRAKLYRYGGEEIAFIYFSDNQVKAMEIMEGWRKAVESKIWREQGLVVTFSGGVCPWRGEDYEALIEKADRLLYKAKSSGKNKVVISTS
ncbi:sensor domain-containing diguanylate cyclase [Cedecea lapagei]|uniref:sensor domain-containing diguanylate cyclase n=1 Tax=Cedecea lapagei TaxID=158823 RepID=UPI001BCF5446